MQYGIVVTHACTPDHPDHGEDIFRSLVKEPDDWSLDDVRSDGIEFSRSYWWDVTTDEEERQGYDDALSEAMGELRVHPNGRVCVYGDDEAPRRCV